MASTANKTFDSPKAAIKHANGLLEAGEISKEECARIEKKMVAEDQEGHLKAWLKEDIWQGLSKWGIGKGKRSWGF